MVRFETPPGRQAQVDFAEFRLPWGKRYMLLVVLGYSRLMWLQFYSRNVRRSVGLLHPLVQRNADQDLAGIPQPPRVP